MKYILFAILFYVLYQFIFHLVVPVYKTTRKIKKSFGEMHAQMQKQSFDFAQDRQPHDSTQPSSSKSTSNPGDYLDFEEVK